MKEQSSRDPSPRLKCGSARDDAIASMSAGLQEVNMCPACIGSAGVILGSAVSTGGLTALVVKVLRKKKDQKSDSKEKE